MFSDTVQITIKSGRGGDGHVSFRRELYVPNGGPDGGDGGKGGDLIFEVDKGLNTLSDFHFRKAYAAGNGLPGGNKRSHGKDGKDLILKVPYGTIIREAKTKKIIVDMSGDNLRVILLKGGRGGLGNMHFSTSSMQAPRYAQPGKSGISLDVILELKLIADVGLVGFPNVGKSTLLSALSNARPKISNYHFTTLNPHLGVVNTNDESFVMADIPGLIEGASMGAGLGDDFLRHIERCKALIHVVDAAGTEGRDPVDDIFKINAELHNYNPKLLTRPVIIACNKIDCFLDEKEIDFNIDRIKNALKNESAKVIPISAATGRGLKELIYEILRLLKSTPHPTYVFDPEYDIYKTHDQGNELDIRKISEGVFSVDGEKIERMIGYTNLESERGFDFFQKFMKDQNIITNLKELGLKEGDTVKISGLEFEYIE